VTGSSGDPELVGGVFRGRPPGERRLVILDSDHSRAHVLRELELFAPRVPPGGYVVVEDSNANGNPVLPDFGPGPREAIEEFLAAHPEFEADRSREKFLMTFNPGGYLRRIR
jgi:cephalosporin hydroxylase